MLTTLAAQVAIAIRMRGSQRCAPGAALEARHSPWGAARCNRLSAFARRWPTPTWRCASWPRAHRRRLFAAAQPSCWGIKRSSGQAILARRSCERIH